MAKQTILWTILPNGRVSDGEFAGQLRVSVVVSPRLTPEAPGQQRLASFPEFLDWPNTLASARLAVGVGNDTVVLRPLVRSSSELWAKLFDQNTPVAGFQFRDMSQVNLRSYPVRNVLGFLRRHYGRLAVQAASIHPTLLPWKDAHPDFRNMLDDLGTRTRTITVGDRKIEVPLPGFSRFFGDPRKSIEARLQRQVFGPESVYSGTVLAPTAEEEGLPRPAGAFPRRALPADWQDPATAGPDSALMSQFRSADEFNFYQANRFYRRDTPTDAQRRMRRPTFANVGTSPPAPEFDFHRIIASFSDYPELLRQLGLVIDCALEDSGPIDARIAAGGGRAVGQLITHLKWSGPRDTSIDQTPRTAWEADQRRFLPRPRSSDHERGLLRLEGAGDNWAVDDDKARSDFDVYQVDPDGASLKTVGFLVNAQNLVAKSLSLRQIDGEITYTTGDKQAVAALRTGGLGISRHDRAGQVAQDAASAALKNQAVEAGDAGNMVLFAEDVLRGYRVDVASVPDPVSPGRWHSLCARQGDYRLIDADEPLKLPPDEGYVSGASTTKSTADGADPDDNYLHESLFRWTGWSLCTPRPGRALRAREDPDSKSQGEESVEVTDVATGGNGLSVSFKALPGSLPRLRFGQLYRMRARLVDLAGNSLAVDDPSLGDMENATEAVGYWRFEPVDPPVVVQRARVSEGESFERLVIRSNFDTHANAYLATPDFAAAIALPASQDFEYTAINERHVIPPKSSQQQCEQHGLFDPFFANPAEIKKGYEIAAREAGSLYDHLPGSQIELITPAKLGSVATTTAVPPKLPTPENPVGDRLSGGQYVIHREALIRTPYLPDGAAAGIALRALPDHSLPGIGGEMNLGPSCAARQAPNGTLVLLVAFAGNWPDRQGLRIVLAERAGTLSDPHCTESFPDDGRPIWNEDTRVLTFLVRKGHIVRLGYSSYVHPAFLGSFGVPQWTSNESQHSFVSGMAALGNHWMLTPYRELVLVHATQQPVCLPELIKLSIRRNLGDPHAKLLCRRVNLHGPSTGKFEIEADWHEWVDDLQKEGPERVEGHGQLGEVQLQENHPNQFQLQAAIDAQRIDPGRERARGDRHEFGDTRFRLIRYRVRASTRFREYLPSALYDNRDLITRLGPAAEGPPVKAGAADDPGAPVLHDSGGASNRLIVPASAPPDDPRVLYTVPTFRWQHSESSGTISHTRLGNGLRVWLDRPWFSSGDGELLGVVLLGNNARFTDIPKHLQALVTQWGLDPLWETALPKSKTRASDFGARVHSEQVRLQERPDAPHVHVVGHRVHWDQGRRLWYCDIELDPGVSYMPFVRLALVRYQPNALGAAKVSKVVLAEFAQVLPRRRAFLKQSGEQVSLTLRGPLPHYGPMKFPVDSEYSDISFIGGLHESGRNRVELMLQTRDPAVDSDLAWGDHSRLASAVVGPPYRRGVVIGPMLGSNNITDAAIVDAADGKTVHPRSGEFVDLRATIDLGVLNPARRIRPRTPLRPVTPVSPVNPVVPALPGDLGPIVNLRDAKIWAIENQDLPKVPGRDRRLVLREFERYYTDKTVPERRSGATHRRRVIEERLVYAVEFRVSG